MKTNSFIKNEIRILYAIRERIFSCIPEEMAKSIVNEVNQLIDDDMPASKENQHKCNIHETEANNAD